MVLGGITSRASYGPQDLQRMYDLAAESPRLALHIADLPWRLSSWSGSNPERTRLWEDEEGKLIAWAILQFPWLTFDFEVRPDVPASGIAPVILEWACDRLAAEAAIRNARLHFFISAREDDTARIAMAEGAGFARNDYGYVRLMRDLTQPIPESELPEGFVIRQLDGKREVPAYVATHRAAFGTTSMTEDWRLATLGDPQYVPELDLVAIGPNGEVAGFCVCWTTPPLAHAAGTRIAHIEPLGVRGEFRRMGLGRSLLQEAFRRARNLGAHSIEVNVERHNQAGRQAYEDVGFRKEFELPFYLRVFG